MNQLSQPQLDWLMQTITGWVAHVPMVSTLLILIGMDVFAGLLVAADRKALSSTISWRGITRKIYTILLVGMAAVIEPFAQGLPIAQIVAMFYCVTEAISILENAAALGLPLPVQLVDTLAKLKEGQKMRSEQKSPDASQRERQIAATEHNSELLQERVNQAAQPVPIPLPVVVVDPATGQPIPHP